MNNNECEYLKQLEQKIDLVLAALENQSKKEKLLGTWVSEKELMLMTGISRNTLLKLRQEGKITRSSISGKKNYYRLTDFKKLLDKNEE